MSRWLRLGIAALVAVATLAACGGSDEEGAGAPTSSATAIGTAHPSDRIPTVAAPVVTQRASTATATARPVTPTPLPPTPTAVAPTPQASAPTVTPSQQARQPVWTVSEVPSGTQVDIVLEDGLGNTYTIASADPQWTQLERWGVDFAGDLNADGVEDVMLFHFTGGAHCCSEYVFFRDTPSGIELDDWFSLGNGGIGSVEDLDSDGVPELNGWDDRLSYFADQSYAASPSLPLVLCRTAKGKYTDCTVQFPQRMQEAADGFEVELREAVQSQATDEEKRRAALGLVTAYLLMAPTDEGWLKVRSLCPECEDWLLQNQAELENRLAYVPPAPPIEAPQ